MYINILFILIMIVAIILVARHEALSKSLKGFVISLFVLVIALATLFEYSSDNQAQSSRALIIGFQKGFPLYCNDDVITNKSYFYESGTASFQPNHTIGETYSIKECSLDK